MLGMFKKIIVSSESNHLKSNRNRYESIKKNLTERYGNKSTKRTVKKAQKKA